MGRCRSLSTAFVGTIILGIHVPSGLAQRQVGIVYRRPTELERPSQQVGGLYTRQGATRLGGPIGFANFSPAFGVPRRPVAIGGDDTGPAPIRLGLISPPYQRRLLATGSIPSWQLEYSSGFTDAVRADTPLAGWRRQNQLPVPGLPSADRMARGTPLQQFFGLVPNEPRTTELTPAAYSTVSEAVEEGTQARVATLQEEGERLLRDATTAGVERPARVERLRRATWAFRTVRNLDRQAALPCVLLAHAALEQGQLDTVVNSLIAAAERDPESFRTGSAVAAYYGDVDATTGRSANLDEQLRQYVRQSAVNPGVDEFVLEAYCARLLGDTPRARAALDKATQQLAEEERGRPGVERLIHALRVTL